MIVVKKLETGKYFGNDGSGNKFDFDKDMATRFASEDSAREYMTDPLGALGISVEDFSINYTVVTIES